MCRPGAKALHPLRQFLEQRPVGVVEDRVDRVEAEPVHVEFVDPVERVVDEEFAHRGDQRVDGLAPGRMVPVGEGLRRNDVDVGAFRAEVIIDDVEQHHDAGGVGRVDQRLEVVRAAIGVGGRVGQHAVVAPVAVTREGGDRHDLDRRHAEIGEVAEPVDGGTEGAFRGEGADVQFVDDRLRPRAAGPAVVAPGIGAGIDHRARPVDI